MTSKLLAGTFCVLAVMTAPSIGVAQIIQSQTATSTTTTNSQGQTQIVQQQTGPEVVESAETGRGVEYGVNLLVPVYTNIANNPLHPSVGLGVQVRGGWEFAGGLSFEASLGYQYAPYPKGAGAEALTTWMLSGGFRYAFLGEYALVPFIGAGVEGFAWSFVQNSSKGTTVATRTEFTLGAYGTVGLAIELSPLIAVEVGAQVHLNFFATNELFRNGIEAWVTPFIGVTSYYE